MNAATQTAIPQSAVDVSGIYAPVNVHLEAVEESIKNIVTPETVLLAQSIAHTLDLKGKLLRPLLSLLVSGATGEIGTSHIETAAVAELIHVATLLHDDVLDESDTRRSRPTVRSQWGNKVSILSGDYLLAQASLKLSMLNNCRLVSIFAQVLSNLCEGEVEQIRTSYNLATTWESYFKKSICKTASLFSACCEAAGVINNLPEERIQDLKTFGENLGIAFQIADDLLDFTSTSEKLGKPVLDDLKNGILNAPILLALEHFAEMPEKHQQFTSIIEALFKLSTEDIVDEATSQAFYQLFDEAGAIEKTQFLAQTFIDDGCARLAFVPESPYRDALLNLARYATERQH